MTLSLQVNEFKCGDCEFVDYVLLFISGASQLYSLKTKESQSYLYFAPPLMCFYTCKLPLYFLVFFLFGGGIQNCSFH